MTTTLYLGVDDVPYADPQDAAPKRVPRSRPGKQRKRARKSTGATKTTGDVAEILEGKYHVMETFYDLHEDEIAEDFAEAMGGALENLLLGAPPPRNPLAAAESAVEMRFRKFLEAKEMDGLPGIPTAASLEGVSHRFKRKRGEPRASFIDTGLYESSMRAGTETT